MFRNTIFNLHIILCICFTVILGLDQNCPRNNACPTYFDYFLIDINPNCYCVPNVGHDVDKVATGLIGNSETHTVTTEDGYILTIFRMPQKNPKGVVVLNHPVTVCSRVWLFQGNESTALWFWQQGYDVWMTNNRGTLYAKRHKTLSPKNRKFWNFTFHEIGYYDHKAQFDYIYNITKTKLILVGHSMSTTSSFIYTALRPKEAEQIIKLNVAMSPIAYLKNVRQKLAPFLAIAAPFNSLTSVLGFNSWYIQLARFLILHFPLQLLLAVFLNNLGGWTFSNFEADLTNLLALQGTSEFSYKIVLHYAQNFRNNGEFRMYDYGKEKNMELYGQEKPPLYPVENITVPTYLLGSYSDTVSAVKDIDILYDLLPSNAKKYGRLNVKGVSHIDAHLGKNRRELLYNKMFELFDKLN